MRYVVIASPLLLFAGVVTVGFWLTADEPAQPPIEDPRRALAVVQLATALETFSQPAPRPEPVAAVPSAPPVPTADARVPRGLAAPLRAVAADVNLCIPHSLERDLGPIDVTVRFTPIRGGAFEQGVQVSSTWNDPQVESCIAEVFEETTFMPEPDGQFAPSEFVFHFPDDAYRGLLGMRFVR